MKKKTEIPPQFGENLAMYRARCGITLKKLSKLTGHVSQLKKWEKNLVLPSLKKMWLISRELEQPIENFFQTVEIPYRVSVQEIDILALGQNIKYQRTRENEKGTKENEKAGIDGEKRKRKMSQIKLASLLGVEWSTVSNWERGRQCPSLLNIYHMGRVFDCRIDFLIQAME